MTLKSKNYSSPLNLSLHSLFYLGLLVILATADPAFAQSAGWWSGETPEPFAGGVLQRAYCDMVYYIEGNLGGVVTIVAGLFALVSAAFGDLKHGSTLVITGICCVCVTSAVSFYFGTFDCQNNAVTTRIADEAVLEDFDLSNDPFADDLI